MFYSHLLLQHKCVCNVHLTSSFFFVPLCPKTRCCRNRASSLRGIGVPEGGCPAGEHMDSLKEKHTLKVSLPMQLLQYATLIMFMGKFKVSSPC